MVEPYFWRSFLASVWRTDCRGAPVQPGPMREAAAVAWVWGGRGECGLEGGWGSGHARLVVRGGGLGDDPRWRRPEVKDERGAAIPGREGAGKGK